MGLELVRDLLSFEQVIGEGQSQALVNRDIIVPDIKPDIAKILSVEGKVNITSKDVEDDRMVVEGDVDFRILYTANGEPQPIYSMNQNANFSHYIHIDGAMPKMESEVNCDIEHIDYERLNGRKLNMQCVLNLRGKVTDRVSLDVVKEAGGVPDIQLLRGSVSVDDIIGENSVQTVVRGAIKIPDGLPAADEILKYSAVIHNKDARVEDDKVVITGSVFVPVLYSSKEENVDIYKVDDDFVFSHTMDIPGAASDMNCYADYTIEDIYAELKEDEEGETRQIDVEVVVGLKTKVIQMNEFPVIIDAYVPSARIECEKKNIAMDLFFGAETAQTMVKESLSLSDNDQDIEKLYDMICKPAVTDYKIVDDKVVIEGVVGCDIIYMARGEEKSVSSFSEEVPFRASVVVPGCKTGMKPEVEVDIESMDCSMLTKDEVEVRIVLYCNVKLYDKVERDFIIKMEAVEGEVPLKKASIIIYVVQPKDTLWMIAKRYYTTVDDIVRVNEIGNPDSILPGVKLIIPKKV